MHAEAEVESVELQAWFKKMGIVVSPLHLFSFCIVATAFFTLTSSDPQPLSHPQILLMAWGHVLKACES